MIGSSVALKPCSTSSRVNRDQRIALQAATRDFGELASICGYTHEEHVVLTNLLGLHRLHSKAERGQQKSNRLFMAMSDRRSSRSSLRSGGTGL